LNVLRRKSPRRITSSAIDRLLFVGLYALVPSVLDALQIDKPDTVIRWHSGLPALEIEIPGRSARNPS
jgi:hypothetical protein